MHAFSEESAEVLYTNTDITSLTESDMEYLKERARQSPRQRCRLCTHVTPSSSLHEMLIVHAKGSYIRPHKHANKVESHHIIEGLATAVLFDDAGGVLQTINLGPHSSGHSFYYRMPADQFHTLIIMSDWFIFHETTTGPFDRSKTIFAPWSPDESDHQGIDKFLTCLI